MTTVRPLPQFAGARIPHRSRNPCLQGLFHFDSSLADQLVPSRVLTPSFPNSVGYADAQFGKGISWSPKANPGDPNNTATWSGTDILPSWMTTGFTLQFWSKVTVLGPATGPYNFLSIGSDISLAFGIRNVSAISTYTINGSGFGYGVVSSGATTDLTTVCYTPGDNTVRIFYNGVFVTGLNISIFAAANFTSITIGDSGTGGPPDPHFGWVDELAFFNCDEYPGISNFALPTAPYYPPG